MIITEDDILYSERILLPKSRPFDDERRAFIKDLRTLDLQAVPGSGKTTALLAKLLIIERYLPDKGGRGVLVISHTNVAVDEIRDRIGVYCPRLFNYPNFVGTIQSFVNEFLAIPYYVSLYGHRPVRVDDDSYITQFNKSFPPPLKRGLEAKFNAKLRSRLLNLCLSDDQESLLELPELKDFTKYGKASATYRELLDFKRMTMREGYLTFNDAYHLANKYLEVIPGIKEIVRRRFAYVFIDEMQDMDARQYELLEDLFYSEDVVYQRIGDRNQAIFNGKSNEDNVWQDRETILRIVGSHRLSEPNAEIVKRLSLYPMDIKGLAVDSKGEKIRIKPHLFVYDDSTILKVIPSFTDIVDSMQREGLLPLDALSKTHVIAWNTTWPEASNSDKVRLMDYAPYYLKSKGRNRYKKDHDTLYEYILSLDLAKHSLGYIQNGIIDALLKLLSLEKIRTEDNLVYTRERLWSYFSKDPEAQEYIRSILYVWSMGIASGDLWQVLPEIREFAVNLVKDLKGVISKVEFLDLLPSTVHEGQGAQVNSIVSLGTAHAVKGSTHMATLYLESAYQKDKLGSYESERLGRQFKGNPFDNKLGVYVKQSARMSYVGLSRPVYLMAFAVHRSRLSSMYDTSTRDLWQIINVI